MRYATCILLLCLPSLVVAKPLPREWWRKNGARYCPRGTTYEGSGGARGSLQQLTAVAKVGVAGVEKLRAYVATRTDEPW